MKEANVVRSSAPITTGLPWMDLAPCRQDITYLRREKLMEHCSQDIIRLYWSKTSPDYMVVPSAWRAGKQFLVDNGSSTAIAPKGKKHAPNE